jgi:hypothetical protein
MNSETAEKAILKLKPQIERPEKEIPLYYEMPS